MRLGKHFVCDLLLVGFCSLASDVLAESAATKRSASGYSNRNIEDALRQVLRQNPTLGSVEASVSRGTVTLMGAVSDPHVKDDLLSRVRDANGVSNLEDEIFVGIPGFSPIDQTASPRPSPCVPSKEVANGGH